MRKEVEVTEALQHVVIVGGGTAGWLTAGVLAADHCASADDGLRVTVIESPDVPILGVGEGTWPSLRDTLRRIGISETDLVRRCNATFKQGSRFDGWRDGGPEDSYYHPFSAPPSADQISPLSLWGIAEGTSFADAVSSQVAVCQAGLAPKQAGTPEFAGVTNYAYHLDAPSFAALLREYCTERLGVRHISDSVVKVELEGEDCISSVKTAEHGDVAADIFVDCTGQRALLIGQHQHSPLTDVSPTLFNDRALALHVPYAHDDEPIQSQTNGTATGVGWIWDIGLQTRRGVGHVFSSAHADEATVRRNLAEYVKGIGGKANAEDARLIRFQSAYREKPWSGNVVAIGMSAGFVEPLEASAIVMIELSATMLSDILPSHRSLEASAARRFNDRFAYRWGRIVDFIKLHYILSKRDEPYWAAHRDESSWSDRLRQYIAQWRHEAPSREDFTEALEIFPAASYAFVLYGMGFETTPPPYRRRRDNVAIARKKRQDLQSMQSRYLAGLPSHRRLITEIHKSGLPAL